MMSRSPDKKNTGKSPQKGEKMKYPGESRGHGTRSAVFEEELRAEKEKFLVMSRDEKRKLYKCGEDNFVTLEDIPIWPEYENKKSQVSAVKSQKTSHSGLLQLAGGRPKYPVNDTLNRKISLYKGDITTLEIDAIVNAANSSLLGGGGVDGAIHSAAGAFLKKECSTLDGCETGDAKITCGYKLPAKYVIHTVGPIGEKRDLLQSAYKRCLEVLKENELTTVAFPCISTGIYGYPIEAAAHVSLETIREWLEHDEYSSKVQRIILCVFLKRDVEVYEELLPLYFPLTEHGPKPKNEDVKEVSETADEKNKKAADEIKDRHHTTTNTTTDTDTMATSSPTTALTAATAMATDTPTKYVTTIRITTGDNSTSNTSDRGIEEPMEEEGKGDDDADDSSEVARPKDDEAMEGDGKREGEKDGEREKASRKKNRGEVKDRKEEGSEKEKNKATRN